MRIAFYAPMKPPDDPVPSGDRTMARAFIAALGRAGHAVDVASRLRLHLRSPDPGRQHDLAVAADHEIERLTHLWRREGAPDLWFTYHNYHKAPDLLGPTLSRRLGVPYVLAEASHAPRHAQGWTSWFLAAERAVQAADLHICLTDRDRIGLAPLLDPATPILDLPPFLDLADFAEPARPCAPHGMPVRLVTVAMMRLGDKLESYRFLAAALGTITDLDWHLDIVGDGPARAETVSAFGALPSERLTWHGVLDAGGTRDRLAQGQLFVWPGFGEAFGLCYLEAQALGLPVVACDVAGVSSVVVADRTGLLVKEASPAGFGAAIADLIRDEARRRRLAENASRFVRRERTLEAASRRLDLALPREGARCR